MLTRKFFLLLTLLTLCSYAYSQTVKVRKEKMTVKGISMDGYAVDLEGTLAEVNSSYVKFLKTIGKTKQGDYITIAEANLNGLSLAQPVFGATRGNGSSTTAWIGFDGSNGQKSDSENAMKALETAMKDFGVKFYRDKIQTQIDESEKARQTVDRAQQRLLYENKSLNNRLENNKKEKVNLEKAIEENKLENETLLRKLEENKKAQDSVAVAAEQVRKVVEMHKEKQRKVN